jgi:hypothetical protein
MATAGWNQDRATEGKSARHRFPDQRELNTVASPKNTKAPEGAFV